MKKTETIALYKEAFLAGKPDEVRRRFEEKDIEKQYSSIIAWKRRQHKGAPIQQDAFTPASILETLRKIKSAVPDLPSLSQGETESLLGVLGEITSDIHNFERIKKGQLLSKLESEQAEINRQRESLQQKIENLSQELKW
ncbi:MAG: hypothetical protein K2K58_00700 [Muribaculaceae bacterium]|nr:hypothetical protein [Muribaculaceae bacterium]